MKKACFVFIILSFTLHLNAQSKVFSLTPSYRQTFHLGDTIIATAQLSTNESGVGSIGWGIISSPGVTTLTPPVTSSSGNYITSSVMVVNPVAGTYVLGATGKSPTGTIGTLIDSLVVLPPLPVCPNPRTVVGYTIIASLINGIWTFKTSSFLFSDGTTQ